MKLYEIMDVDEERIMHVVDVLDRAKQTCEDIKEMTVIVRNELEGNERDMAMAIIGVMLDGTEL